MTTDEEIDFPPGQTDERELFLSWLRYLRGAVLRNLDGLDDEQARWRPDEALLPLIGILHHLTHVEARWIDGGFFNGPVERADDELLDVAKLKLEPCVLAYEERGARSSYGTIGAHTLTRRSSPIRSGCQPAAPM